MAKQIKGWRDAQSWDYKGDDFAINAISQLSRSDDGWVCPHCETQEDLAGAELSNYDVMNMVFGSEAIKINCGRCGEEYFVKCSARFLYASCADDKFEEG